MSETAGARPSVNRGHRSDLERLRLMAEESSDIIVLYENGRAVCASRALTRILGIEPQQLEDGHYLDVVHPSKASAWPPIAAP